MYELKIIVDETTTLYYITEIKELKPILEQYKGKTLEVNLTKINTTENIIEIYNNYIHLIQNNQEYGDKYGDTKELIEIYEKKLIKAKILKESDRYKTKESEVN